MFLKLFFFIFISFIEIFSHNRLQNIKVYKDKDFPGIDNYMLQGPNIVNPIFNGELNAALNLIKDNDIVFDIGANVGEYTYKLVNSYKNLIIHCFEPAPIFNLLKDNINKNKIEYIGTPTDEYSNFTNINGNKIFFNNIALSKTNELKKFYFYNDTSVISGLYHFVGFDNLAGKKPTEMNVAVKKIDTFCRSNNIKKINYLKIDTEGSDYDVLLGAKKLLKNKKIKVIQFEYMEAYKSANATLKNVCKYLTSHGYRIFKIVPDGIVHIRKWRDSLENYLYANFIAVSDDNNWNVMLFE